MAVVPSSLIAESGDTAIGNAHQMIGGRCAQRDGERRAARVAQLVGVHARLHAMGDAGTQNAVALLGRKDAALNKNITIFR